MVGSSKRAGGVAAAVLFLAAGTGPTWAQAVRTWVSGVGDDANPCSRTSPCKTFAGAISKTAASGEISVLDPGGYGTVTITKAISIVAEGVEGSVLASSTTGITINAATTDNVALRGLSIEGSGTGLSGIKIIQANNVYISNTVVRGFQSSPGYGIDIEPTGNGPRVYLNNVDVSSNITGVYVHAGSFITGVVLDHCTISTNSMNSLVVDSSTSVVRAQSSSFANNPVAVSNGAQLISNGNNFFAGGIPAGTTVSPLQ